MKPLLVRFPIVTGSLVAKLKASLAADSSPVASGVKVAGKLPKASERTTKMVSFRDDSGTSQVLGVRRFGVNVYAATSVDAEKLALICMSALAQCADGNPITSVSDFFGPVEVELDETNPITVGKVALSHFYFNCTVTVRGSAL